jgi:hypothetical protein
MRWRGIGAVALLALAGGCGAGEYEGQMRKTQERVQYFDEENKQLGGPLTMPNELNRETNTWVPMANVFLRAPRGISDRPAAARRGGMPARYEAPVPSKKDVPAFTAVELAFGKGDEDLARKMASWFPGATVPGLMRREDGSVPLRGAEFDYWDTRALATAPRETFEVPVTVAFYVTDAKKGQTQVAVAYWMSRTRKGLVRNVLTMSLKTLAADAEADARRAQHSQRSPWAVGGK